MTPKEKALELMNTMYKRNDSVPLSRYGALLAVDEIIKTGLLIEKTLINVPSTKIHIEFWEEVKQEIEKL